MSGDNSNGRPAENPVAVDTRDDWTNEAREAWVSQAIAAATRSLRAQGNSSCDSDLVPGRDRE